LLHHLLALRFIREIGSNGVSMRASSTKLGAEVLGRFLGVLEMAPDLPTGLRELTAKKGAETLSASGNEDAFSCHRIP
jgi:hypothetical protein